MPRCPPLRLPDVPPGVRFGVGFDMPWGGGFVADAAGDRASPGVKRFLANHSQDFDYLFVSWQPRSRSVMRLRDYVPAWDDLLVGLGGYPLRAVHQTALNLAASSRYDRREILAFTNELVGRYDLAWVNEDLGFWSLRGRPLPYPLPPVLTDEGLEVCVRNIAEAQARLDVPLVVEFPGFSEGWSLVMGEWDAYDFFREVVERTGSPCNLDTGHLLSWRWLGGARGDELLDGLDRLPLEHCVETHLAGVEMVGERFVDAHHGVLHPIQYRLLDQLLLRCPNLLAVTLEDPQFDDHGVLAPSNVPTLHRLGQRMREALG